MFHLPSGRQRRTTVRDVTGLSDARLVTLIARYDEAALAEVYRRHGGAVYGLARRVLNGSEEAEDVTQEIFLRLWNEPDRFDSERGTLRTYLLTKTHGRAVDVIRSHTSRQRREVTDAEQGIVIDGDLERQILDLAVADEVQRALTSLPSEERMAIELAYFGGYTYTEVAERLQQPEGTVKSRIRSGMRRMRGQLLEVGIAGAG
jgi:RNA polymerase sigma-70 factor, ECF subfamily